MARKLTPKREAFMVLVYRNGTVNQFIHRGLVGDAASLQPTWDLLGPTLLLSWSWVLRGRGQHHGLLGARVSRCRPWVSAERATSQVTNNTHWLAAASAITSTFGPQTDQTTLLWRRFPCGCQVHHVL